jgi:hypothetical protein
MDMGRVAAQEAAAVGEGFDDPVMDADESRYSSCMGIDWKMRMNADESTDRANGEART